MIYNYIKIAWRNIVRNKIFSIINILGLATGLAVTLSIIQFARFELGYENTHQLAQRMVRITIQYMNNGLLAYEDSQTYRPLGPLMASEIPEVENYTRLYHDSEEELLVGEKRFREPRLFFAENSFFKMFTYPFIQGNEETALSEPFQVVLTESTAKKYFGEQQAMGQVIKNMVADTVINFTVVGVIPDSPPNTHLKFDLLVSYATGGAILDWKPDEWCCNNDYTYLLLNDADSYDPFLEKLEQVNRKLREMEEMENETIVAELVPDIHLYSKKGYEPEPTGNGTAVAFLMAIAAFVMLIAWVNYINLSTAKSLERAKEVGIRKVIGSNRSMLQLQFLIESGLSNIIAGVLSLSILQLSLPFFHDITGLPSTIGFVDDGVFWLIFMMLVSFSILLSGLYPALLLSSYKPVQVLKGKFSNSQRGHRLRKILVILQFSLTIILLTGTFVINEQLSYMQNKDLGMNMEQTLVVNAPFNDAEREHIDVFKNAVLSNSNIKAVSQSGAVPGLPEHVLSSTTGVKLPDALEDNKYNFHVFPIDNEFIDLMSIEMVAGESFKDLSDVDSKILVNEETLRRWKIEDPQSVVGRTLHLWGEDRTIIGVVQDFHQMSVKTPHLALIIFHIDTYHWWDYVTIKIDSDDMKRELDHIQRSYEATFPGSVFTYFFLDERYDAQYKSDERFLAVFEIMTSLAIFIAGLGLFGLVSFTIAQRTKEIGVRKVLGASVVQILRLLSSSFLQLISIATLLSVPIAYLLVSGWLESFPYRIDIQWWLMVTPVFLIFMVAVISIAAESLKAARRNPVDALRYE